MITSNPKVSVCITTYNHEKFISQALEGALMQQTDFDFEIIVGEDDSSDRTREIVKSYASDYPDKIRLFLNDRKNVIYINGKPTGRWNFVNNLKHANGKYIAICEGDDYWTDPQKLQKQIDLLDHNPSYAMCFHPVNVLIDGKINVHSQRTPEIIKDFYTIDDLLLYSNFITTCSVVYRAIDYTSLPDWFIKTYFGDWVLHLLSAQNGLIGYINEVMGVYRIHPGSIWSSQKKSQQIIKTIETRCLVDQKMHLSSSKFYQQGQSRLCFLLAEAYGSDNLYKAGLYILRSFLLSPRIGFKYLLKRMKKYIVIVLIGLKSKIG